MGRLVTVREAAVVLGVSDDTVKRRLKLGQLQGQQEKIRNGFRWLVLLPEDEPVPAAAIATGMAGLVQGELERLRDEVTFLRTELERRHQEVNQLHVLLGQAQSQLTPQLRPP